MQSSQVYLTVARPHIERVTLEYTDRGYLLIHSAELSSNKVLLTFDKMAEIIPEQPLKPLKAVKLNSSDEIPDQLLEEVFKK